MKALRATVWLILCVGCSAGLPEPFAAAKQHAEQAYARGEYDVAAGHWQRARDVAPNAREREEASYRLAATLERDSQLSRADPLYAELADGTGERAARAAFSRAALAFERDDPEAGSRMLREAILRFPNTGLARGAASRLLMHLEKTASPKAALRETEVLCRQLTASDLAEYLEFERARRVEALGNVSQARALYLGLAHRFPYPRGTYWDDALLSAARIDLTLRRFKSAVSHLETLLASREIARLSGSYERKSFAEARYLLAEIQRDHLKDLDRARLEFRRVFVDHPTSRLGDDALFEETLIARRQGNVQAACDAMRLMAHREPSSRYVPCSGLLCPELTPTTGTCRDYLRRTIERRLEGPGPAAPNHSSSSM